MSSITTIRRCFWFLDEKTLTITTGMFLARQLEVDFKFAFASNIPEKKVL